MPGMNPATGRWARDGEEIVISVRKAFTTPRGTRLLRRHLGVVREQLLDRPITPAMLGPVAQALAESLRDEPRVELRRITIDRATSAGAVALAAEIKVVATGQTKRVKL